MNHDLTLQIYSPVTWCMVEVGMTQLLVDIIQYLLCAWHCLNFLVVTVNNTYYQGL